MNHELNDTKQKAFVKTIVAAGIILLIVLNFTQAIGIIKNIYKIIYPLLLGAGIAFVLNIPVSKYEKVFFPGSKNKWIIKMRRGACIILSILTITVIILIFISILIPQLSKSISLLSAGLPTIYNRFVEWIDQYTDKLPMLQQKLEEFSMDRSKALGKGLNLFGNWIWGTASLMSIIFSKLTNLLIAFIFSIYILFGKEKVKKQFDKLLSVYVKGDKKEKLYECLQIANESFTDFFVGQCKEALILGLLCTIGMIIFRFPYATTIGSVIGLTALIPMLGAYLGAAIGFLLIVMINPLKAVLFLVFIIILQQVEGNLIYPKVVGESIGLPGIWVFAAIIIGGGFMGITGILIGVPAASTVYKLLRRFVNKRLKTENFI